MPGKAKKEEGRRLSYRFRLYPTKEQERFFACNFGCCRYAYNHFLQARIDAYAKTRETVMRPKIVPGTDGERMRDANSKVVYEEVPNPDYDPNAKPMKYADTSKALTQLKKTTLDKEGRAWLKEADSTSLQYALRNLDAAYENYFRRLEVGGKPGFPKFKSAHSVQSCKTAKCTVEDGAIVLLKAGRVKARVHREVEGKIVSATVSRTPTGKYYATINVKEAPACETTVPRSDAVGVAYGLSPWAVTSDGAVYDFPERVAALEKRLDREKRKLSRKAGGRKGETKSVNYEKQRLRVARLEERIANIRRYAIHKFSRELVDEYGVIVSQDMEVKTLVKSNAEKLPGKASRALNAKILASNFAEANRQLAYKTEWTGRAFVEVPAAASIEQARPECMATDDLMANEAKSVLHVGSRILGKDSSDN